MLSLEDQRKAIHQIGWNIKNMSFIIGAGFSKNVSKQYLSWWELMQDMVHQMYGPEMSANDMSVGDIIDKYGYLGVASEYVRRKGYHEAIDDYIEKRTPVLVENKEKTGFNLYLNGRMLEKNVDTSLHKTLLDLSPKNIYTFNYDNTFECHEDKVELPDQQENVFKERKLRELKLILINVISGKEKIIKDAFKALSMHPDNKDLSLQLDNAINEYNREVVDRAAEYIALYRINAQADLTSILTLNNKILQNVISELDGEGASSRKNDDSFLLATSGSDISIAKYSKAIFKLHGSLRKYNEETGKFEGEYGFDTDNHVQYIITQKDYDTYSKKHEPFVDLMRISLLRDSFCIIGFSCDDPNFLLWINWVKDVYDRAKSFMGDRGHKYYINVGDAHLPDDKSLLLETHYIDILNLADIYPKAIDPKSRLIAFFRDIQYCGYETDYYKKLWDETNLWESSVKTTDLKYNSKDIEWAWNESNKDPLSFMDTAFIHSRDSIFNYIGRVIVNGQLNDDLAKLFYLSVTRACLPYYEFLQDIEIPEFLNLIGSEEVKKRYLTENEFQKLLKIGDCNTNLFPSNIRHHIDYLKRVFNFNYKDYDDFLGKWNPVSQLDIIRKCIFMNDKVQIKNHISLWLHQELYYNTQEYYNALTFLNIYRWGLGYGVIDEKSARRISDEIKRLNEEEPLIVEFYQYKEDISEHLTEKSEVKPFGSISTSIKFSDYDDAATSAIKFISFLAKTGYTTNIGISNLIDKKMWIKVVEKAYEYYPFACLYYSSLYYQDNSLSKRIGQLYAYNQTLVNEGIIAKLLEKILNACILYKEYVYVDTLITYACEFINVVNPSLWQENFKKFIKSKDIIKWDSNKWHTHDSIFRLLENGLSQIEDRNFKNSLALQILSKGSGITNDDNSILLKCINKGDYTRDIKKALVNLTKLKPTLAIAMILFNNRKALSPRMFQNWLKKVPDSIIGSKVILPAIALLSRHSPILKERTFWLVENSSSLWSTGISLDNEGNVSSIYGGIETLYIDSVEEYVTLPPEVSKKIYNTIDGRLDEIQKAINKKFIDQFNEYWTRVLVSMRCFLVRHRVELHKEDNYEAILEKCYELYPKICDYKTILGKLTDNKAYRVSLAISELDNVIHTDGINKHLVEISYLLYHIADFSCAAIYNGLSLINRLIKKRPNVFKKENLKEGLVLLLNNYKQYFNGEESCEWDLNARKEVIEKLLMSINDFLASIGCSVESWNNYQPIFWINKTSKF